MHLAGFRGKKALVVGDVFRLGDSDWIVTGIMKSEGTIFGSEIWAKRIDRIFKPFGKDTFSTLVLRSEKESLEASRAIDSPPGQKRSAPQRG